MRGGLGDERAGSEEESRTPLAVNKIRGDVQGAAVQARDIHGGVHVTVEAAATADLVPVQLPPAHGLFTGRDAEIKALDAMAASGHTLVRIGGVGGSGKTSLATHWASRVSSRYPDGILYADLGGHEPDHAADPTTVLVSFLLALGARPESMTDALDEQVKLFRTMTSGRRLLVLLDNAASAGQVRALLPGPECTVLVTTRWSLAGLAVDGARFLELGPLDEEGAARILASMVGLERATAEPQAIREVARFCGGLPLAVRVAGAQLAAHPRRMVSRLAAELADEKNRLAKLSLEGDVSIAAAIDLSYCELPEPVARSYRALSLLFVPNFDRQLAAAVLGTDASVWLENLIAFNLLDETADGRYLFPDLVRLHARQRADADQLMRDAVITRAIEWYLREAVGADRALLPGRDRLYVVNEVTDHPDPLGWLESELPGLVAAVHAAHDMGLHERAWQLCEALTGLFFHRKYFTYWIDTHETGVASAIACGNERAEVTTRVRLGLAYLQLRRIDGAEPQFRAALEVARRAGYQIGEASALEHLGLIQLVAGHAAEAAACFSTAREIFRDVGRPRGVMLMTRRLGESQKEAARYDEAIDILREARTLASDLGEPYHEMRTLTSLGQAYTRSGHPTLALGAFEEARAIAERTGDRHEAAGINAAAAEAELALGRDAQARAHLESAHAAYLDLAAPEAEDVAQALTELQKSH